MAEQPQSGDGLVMPEAFPCKSDNINVENVKSASAKLKSMGQTIDSKMDTIVGLWNGLPAVYVAPEAEQAYGLMAPAATASEAIKTKFEKASSALDTFADAIGPVKSELASLESEAATFRSNTLSTYGDKWRDHQEVVDRNNELLGRYAKIVETMTTAAATCATVINGLLDGVSLPAVEGISAEAIMKSGEIMPWGGAVEKNRNCAESVGHGVGNFAKNTWEGVQALFGRGADGSWSWENAGNTWLGIGDFAMSVWVVKNPLVAAGVALIGGKDGVQWVADRYKVVATAVAGMAGFDLEAHDRGEDGFHKWRKDGIATLTESVLNVASTRIPGAGAAKTVLGSTKAGAAAVKALNMTTRLADYAVPGGGWLVRGGVKLFDLGLEKCQSLRNKSTTHLGEVETAPKPSPLNPEKQGTGNPSPKASHGQPEVPSSSTGGGGSGVSKSSGPGPDFLPPRNPGGPKLNPLGLNLDANNPITGGGGHTHPGNNPIGGHTGTSSGTGAGAGSGHTGTSSGAGGSGHVSTSGGTGTGTGPGHGGGAGAGNGGHAGTGGSGGSNAGGSHQPHTNPNGGSRPDSLLEKPRTRHDPEETPTAKNSHEENPAGGKSPTRPAPKDPSTTRTGSDGGEAPRTHHGQENTGPSSSRGNSHGHGGESGPPGNENPARSADRSRHSPTEPVDPGDTPQPRNTTPETSPDSKHNPEQPDHPTGPEHPQRHGQESSSGDVKHPPGGDGHGEGVDQPTGGGKGPRKVPGAFYDEDGRPLYDKDGNPLEVDRGDGKRHYASDPAETYRDSKDALQNKEGGYGKDPYTGWDKDVDVFNDREPGKNHPWDDATHDDNYHEDRQKRTDLDTTAREKIETAKTTFDDLKSYGMNPEGKSFNKLKSELSELLPYIDLKHADRANEIFDVLDDAAAASEKAGRASEWLGERAAVHRNKDLGRDTIIGDPPDNPNDFTRTGPGKVDVAAIEGDKTFVVDEAKSGDSPNYSSRATENGVRAQQGTLDYIKDLLSGKNQDSRIIETLTRLKQEGKHPKFFENLAAGKVELAYELIQARTNGNVTASNFRIAPPGGKIMLTWGGKGDLKITIVPKGK